MYLSRENYSQNVWTNRSHPSDFPAEWRRGYTELVGAAHSPGWTLWRRRRMVDTSFLPLAQNNSVFYILKQLRNHDENILTVISTERWIAYESL